MAWVVVGSWLGFAAPGAISQVAVIKRVPARMLLEPSAFFLLSKVDLSQYRMEREALDSVINEIDERVVGVAVTVPAEQLAAATTAQEAAAALAAAASTNEAATGGGFGPMDVLTGLLHPIDPLLPVPAGLVPTVALYYVWSRLRSPAQAVDGSASGLTEQGATAAKARHPPRPPKHPPTIPYDPPKLPAAVTLPGHAPNPRGCPAPRRRLPRRRAAAPPRCRAAALPPRPLTRASRVLPSGDRSRRHGAAQRVGPRPNGPTWWPEVARRGG